MHLDLLSDWTANISHKNLYWPLNIWNESHFFPHDVRRRFYLIDRCVTFTRSFNAIWMNCNVYFLHASSVCLHLNLTIDFLQRNEHYLNQDQLSHFCTCNYLTVSAAYISNIDPLKIVAIIVLLTLLLLPIIEY